MNFWEARQAALEGKTVKCWRAEWCSTYPAETFFSISLWSRDQIEGKWEIVEELKTTTKYLNVYPTHYGDWDIHSSTEDAHYHAHSNALLGTIEITVDENGKLISAKKV